MNAKESRKLKVAAPDDGGAGSGIKTDFKNPLHNLPCIAAFVQKAEQFPLEKISGFLDGKAKCQKKFRRQPAIIRPSKASAAQNPNTHHTADILFHFSFFIPAAAGAFAPAERRQNERTV